MDSPFFSIRQYTGTQRVAKGLPRMDISVGREVRTEPAVVDWRKMWSTPLFTGRFDG
jgi:hypothetical protein